MRPAAARTAGALIVTLAAALFHASYAFHGLALFDEGLLADGAWRVRDGAALGRDAFVPYGPAGYWVLAPCFAWFGQSVATLRLVAIAVQALADGALFALAASSGGSLVGGFLAAVLLAAAHGSLHKSFLLLAALLALIAARRLAARADAPGALQAGACAGLAFLFRHDAGAFAAVALVAGCAADASPSRAPLLERLAALGAGFALVVGPAFLVLIGAGMDVGSWWAHEWQRIAVQERIEVGLAAPWEAGGARFGRVALFLALVGAPLVHLAWGGAALRRRWRAAPLAGDGGRVASALFGLLLLNQARLIPSTNHLFQAFAPVALGLADLLARREHGWLRRSMFALLVAGVVTWAALGRSGPYSGTFKQRIDDALLVDLPTAGIRLRRDYAAGLIRVVQAIRARSGANDTLVTSPGAPLLGFLAERHLALPYAEPSYYYHDERFQQEAIAALERAKPALFVTDGSEPANFRFEEAAPLVAAWLARRFVAVDSIGPFTLYARAR